MSTPENQSFFIYLEKRDGKVSVFGATNQENEFINNEEIEGSSDDNQIVETVSYITILRDFNNNMNFYLRLVPLLISTDPEAWTGKVVDSIESLAVESGNHRADLSTESRTVYELPSRFLRSYQSKLVQFETLSRATDHVPEVMIIGLISMYDAFLSQLLSLVFESKPELIFTSQKSLTFAEIKAFGSIDAAQKFIIDREVEGIIRESHHEQFKIMERVFSMKLKEGLTIWPQFIELCERRNLFTHTGGHASKQYLENCIENGAQVRGVSVGTRLGVDPPYFRSAVNAVHEIGLKLCYVLWRKFEKSQSDLVDRTISKTCENLIKRKNYEVSRSVLEFCSTDLKRRGAVESTRRMMIINLSSCLKLQGNNRGSFEVLNSEDWSAIDPKFKLYVAALKGEKDEAARLMQQIGNKGDISESEYRKSPIFQSLQEDEIFKQTFEQIFGESLSQSDVSGLAAKPVGLKISKRANLDIDPVDPGSDSSEGMVQ